MIKPKYDCLVEPHQIIDINKEIEGMVLWTIYDHPTDFPNHYVARAFSAKDGPTKFLMIHYELEPLQQALASAGMTYMLRDADDEPQIVETWI